MIVFSMFSEDFYILFTISMFSMIFSVKFYVEWCLIRGDSVKIGETYKEHPHKQTHKHTQSTPIYK